jgi:hypothetical protein
LATGKRLVGLPPLAFGEGDTKARIKNVLNFRKPSRWVVAVSAILVIGLSVGLAVNSRQGATTNRDLQYIGINGFTLGDIVTDSMIVTLTPTERYTSGEYDYNFEEARYSLDEYTNVIRKLWVNVYETGVACSLNDTSVRSPWTALADIRGYFGEGKQGWQDRSQRLRYVEYAQKEGRLSATVRFVYMFEVSIKLAVY